MLPHGIPQSKQRRYYSNAWPQSPPPSSGTGAVSDLFGTSKRLLFILLIAAPSFFLGTTVSLYAGVDCSHKSKDMRSNHDRDESVDVSTEVVIERRVKELVKKREEVLLSKHTALVHKLVEERVKEECGNANSGAVQGAKTQSKATPFLDPDAVGNMIAGMAMTHKDNFTSIIDPGVPFDKLVQRGSNHVLVLYSSDKAMPDSLQGSSKKQTNVPKLESAETALENCEHLHVLMNHHAGGRKQCLALVPQYESYHLQNWMRVPEKGNGLHGKIDPKESLKLVSRGMNSNGLEEFPPPRKDHFQQTFDLLRNYLESLPTVLKDLQRVIKNDLKPYSGKAIIVMVCNFGQSELLINFVCHAKSKGFDISSILVFATDKDTEALAKSLGLAAYYDEHNFGEIPAEAAERYGDKRFSAMMLAKVICVQLINYLGYDFLFQDVDILWYQHPLIDYFAKAGHWSKQFDVIFQDDGGHSVRYAPYSANSGFYFVRCNDRTRNFVNSLLLSSQIVMATDSHQQAMIAVLNEQVSLYGLRLKVVSRDENDLPGGYQWNRKDGKYMKAMFKGDIKPIIFHMSWTINKDNKVKYFQQMGSWHVEEKCIAKKKEDIAGASSDLTSTCCAAQPIFKCHYKDKPSIQPCKDSPSIDKNGNSFW